MNNKYDLIIYEKKKIYKRLDVLLFFFYIFIINHIIKNKKFEASPSDYEYLELLKIKENNELNNISILKNNISNFNELYEGNNFEENIIEENEINNIKEIKINEIENEIKDNKINENDINENNINENKINENINDKMVPIIIGKFNLINLFYSIDFLFIILFIIFHIMVFLLSQWNINIYLLVAFSNLNVKDKKIYLYYLKNFCTHIYIKPIFKNKNETTLNNKERFNSDANFYRPKATIVELQKYKNNFFFFYKQKKYLFNYKTFEFESLKHFDDFIISFYINWRGLIESDNTYKKNDELIEYYKKIKMNIKNDNMNELFENVNLLYNKKNVNDKQTNRKRKNKNIQKNEILNEESLNDKIINNDQINDNILNKENNINNNLKKTNKIIDLNENEMHNIDYVKHYFELPNDIYVHNNISKYGMNVYDIPSPSFKKLLNEAILSPFFIFQSFSIILWIIDNYWYFGFFSLLILFFLEAQMIHKKIKEFELINSMKLAHQNVYVYRNLNWKIIKSSMLLPGDIYIIENLNSYENICTCETLLIDGMCIMDESILTGESIPLIKVSIDKNIKDLDKLNIKNKHKKNVIYAGTNILMTKNENDMFDNKKIPTNGCIGIVLKNGFTTYQGKLIRTIINTSEKVNSSSFDSIVFLLILLLFSICSSIYVVYTILYSHKENNLYKLILSVSHIVTAVVPPEFPITLTLAVTISMVYLCNIKIYCSEPFRLPFSGKAEICAFDKTGTLTEDNMKLLGLFGIDNSIKHIENIKNPIIDKQKIPFLSLSVICGCHSLCIVNNKLLGDSLEKNSFLKLNCVMKNLDNVYVNISRNLINTCRINNIEKTINQKVKFVENFYICKRFLFSSEMQRMTCIVLHEGYQKDWYGVEYTGTYENQVSNQNENNKLKKQYIVVSKGSPEIMKKFLKTIPNDYNNIYNTLTIKGYRVLCLAAKIINEKMYNIKNIKREEIEKDLIFCGFLTFICPLKKYTPNYITDIKNAGLKNIMITGDNILTACQVAIDVNMIPSALEKDIFILKIKKENNENEIENENKEENKNKNENEKIDPWKNIEDIIKIFNIKDQNDENISKIKNIILENKDNIDNTLYFSNRQNNIFLPFIHNYDYLKICSNLYTLCITGDVIEYIFQNIYPNSILFENLVENVTIFSRVSPKNKEIIIKTLNKIGHITIMCGDGTNDMAALKAAHVGISLLSVKICFNNKDNLNEHELNNAMELNYNMKLYERKKKYEELMKNMDDSLPLIKLGEASIASPFTYKGNDIKCVREIISCGRCTLSKVIMMYKLMIVNSLITAFSVSILTLDGVKISDIQNTIISIVYTSLIVVISKVSPLKNLSNYSPPNSLFNLSVILSLLFQVFIHFFVLIYGWKLACSFRSTDYIPDINSDFTPNLVNTCIYYLIYCINLSIFSTNYEGLPFMLPLHKKKEAVYIFVIYFFFIFIQIMDILPFLNKFFLLVPFPSNKMKFTFLALVMLDLLIPYFISISIRNLRLYIYNKFNKYI